MVHSGGNFKKKSKKSDTDAVLATHKYLGSKGAEINRNEIFVDLPHICQFFIFPIHSSCSGLTAGLMLQCF